MERRGKKIISIISHAEAHRTFGSRTQRRTEGRTRINEKTRFFFHVFYYKKYKKKKKHRGDTEFSNNAPFSAPTFGSMPRALREVFCKYLVFQNTNKKTRDAFEDRF
jgi:hypothetical protein